MKWKLWSFVLNFTLQESNILYELIHSHNNRAWDPLQLELQVVVSWARWVLDTEHQTATSIALFSGCANFLAPSYLVFTYIYLSGKRGPKQLLLDLSGCWEDWNNWFKVLLSGVYVRNKLPWLALSLGSPISGRAFPTLSSSGH